MLRRFFPPSTDAALDPTSAPSSGGSRSAEPDLAVLPIVGITRRRAAILLGVLLAAWVIVLFARQVSEAAAATGRAEGMMAANANQQTTLAALQGELDLIQRPTFIAQQARAYGLGGPKEIAFTLEAGAPALGPDAPGSAGSRVGASTSLSPLERWLTLLFGAGG